MTRASTTLANRRAAPRGRSRAPWWLWSLVVALLGVATFGQVHRIAHADAASAGLTASAATEPRGHGHDHGFGHDEGSAECRLYDQLSQGDQVPAPAVWLPMPAVAAIATPAAPGGITTAAPRAAQARGPPRA